MSFTILSHYLQKKQTKKTATAKLYILTNYSSVYIMPLYKETERKEGNAGVYNDLILKL